MIPKVKRYHVRELADDAPERTAGMRWAVICGSRPVGAYHAQHRGCVAIANLYNSGKLRESPYASSTTDELRRKLAELNAIESPISAEREEVIALSAELDARSRKRGAR